MHHDDARVTALPPAVNDQTAERRSHAEAESSLTKRTGWTGRGKRRSVEDRLSTALRLRRRGGDGI